MRRPRHPRSSARLSISLLSVLALIAFACVPALAQAECTDSSCKQYEVEIPTAEGEHKKKPGKSQNEPEAEASTPHKAKTGKSEPEGSENGSESEEQHAVGAGNNGGGNNNGGGPSDKGNTPNGGNQASTGLEDEKALGSTTQGQNASHSSGGSSPLVPILIAIAVLAAISIGAVVYRQRRQDGGGSGSPVSPKAG
jgi:cobalamin biosynthesis Mg chelatase CobN